MPTLNTAYASATDTTALAITLASLGSSATFLSGRESGAVVNTSNLFLDALVSGQITVGTSPTANTQIRVYTYAPIRIVLSTVTYPDVMDGTDSAETVTSAGILRSAFRLAAVLDVDSTTTGRAYPIRPFSVASLYGGVMPTHWGVYVAHNTGVNLHATGANHYIHYMGIEATSA